MNPPYLLLDIDGVPPDDPVTVWLNQDHGPLLTDVIRSGLVLPVWCTSWRQDATTLIGPLLGLPPLPHVDLPRPQITTSHPNGYLWKRDHVDAWLADAPAAWIDDDFTALDHAWARARNAEGIATLLIQPDPHVGLLPAHLEAALEWAAALPTPAERDAGGRQEASAAETVQLP